ncbi:MAG: hypothetical protein ACTHKG_14420 [Nocardioides sp.]
MRYSTPLLGLIGAAAGLVVAATGYQLAAAPAAPATPSSDALAAVGRPLPAAPAQVRTRYLPCTPPAELHHGVCVTHQWRTTVVYDEPVVPASAPRTSTQGAAGPVRAAAPASAEVEDEDDAYVGDAEHAGEDDGHGDGHEAEDPGEHDEPGDD